MFTLSMPPAKQCGGRHARQITLRMRMRARSSYRAGNDLSRSRKVPLLHGCYTAQVGGQQPHVPRC